MTGRHDCEWLNTATNRLWPHVNRAVGDTLIDVLGPMLMDPLIMPSMLKGVRIDRLNFGDRPPRFDAVRVSSDSDLCLDLDLAFWGGNPDIALTVLLRTTKTKVVEVPIELQSLALAGCLTVQFKPLVPVFPLFSGISIGFTHRPRLDFSLSLIHI